MSESRPTIVAIDSMTLVWGIRSEGSAVQQQRAQCLFAELDRSQSQIILPAVALSEYLTPVAESQRSEVVAAISSRFQIRPFDTKCAAVAARLFCDGKSGRPAGQPNSRKTLRADCLIIATAYCHGARIFYSADKKCRNLAETIETWKVCDLPEGPGYLFDL
ncbi:MAG: PIN domain-containing protein [Phycisphaerales bacterium]|nr:PIN domain-containing protein [Phycisphaerales bacterium]